MTILSPARAAVPLLPGLKLYSRGKVRDTYDLGGNQLLVVATDGVSIFDFVLDALVPMKGIILTALNHFWCKYLEGFKIPTHLISAGHPAGGLTSALPASFPRDAELMARATVVRKLTMHPVEFIARGVITGSAYKLYAKNDGVTYRHVLPSGLRDGDTLPFVMDTPTTKAVEGHDEPLDAAEIRRRYPEETYRTIQIFQILSSHARVCGIRFMDTKFEFGADTDGTIVLGDEVGTGDSSRFCDETAWQESRMRGDKLPPPLDKQLVRAFGIEHGVHKLDPENPDHVREVHVLTLPDSLIRATTKTYRYLFWRLTGCTIEHYVASHLGIHLPRETPRVVVIVGSESDLSAVREGLAKVMRQHEGLPNRNFPVAPSPADIRDRLSVHVISCHRNPGALADFALGGCEGADAVIAVGSKAFALPGILYSFLRARGKEIPVVGVALGNPGTESFEAARLSIKELPDSPVVMDELTGSVYAGPEGIAQALKRILTGELPPPKARQDKPPYLNIPLSDLLASS